MANSKSRSKDKDGGPDDERNDRLTSSSTAPKGRMNQPRGSSKHNTSPRHAKKMKRGMTDNLDLEF